MLAFSPLRWVALAALAGLVLVGQTDGASPRDELLRYVPEDVGFVAMEVGAENTGVQA